MTQTPAIPVEQTTRRLDTGEIVGRKTVDVTVVRQADPSACAICAVRHETSQPHNASSLFYQYDFRARTGRWPTWKDAIAHCDPETRARWESALREKGAWTEPAADAPASG